MTSKLITAFPSPLPVTYFSQQHNVKILAHEIEDICVEIWKDFLH